MNKMMKFLLQIVVRWHVKNLRNYSAGFVVMDALRGEFRRMYTEDNQATTKCLVVECADMLPGPKFMQQQVATHDTPK